MKKIPLWALGTIYRPNGHGKLQRAKVIKDYALIDDEDWDRVNQYKWFPSKKYAHNWQAGPMHRFIMNCPKGKFIDHIDNNGFNNQKNNLRICTHKENLRNQVKWSKPTSSKHKGVVYRKKIKLWSSAICVNKKTICLGTFTSEVEAAKAYNDAAIKYFGEFAKLNEI